MPFWNIHISGITTLCILRPVLTCGCNKRNVRCAKLQKGKKNECTYLGRSKCGKSLGIPALQKKQEDSLVGVMRQGLVGKMIKMPKYTHWRLNSRWGLGKMKKCILINKESILINRASGILAGRKMLIRNLSWLKNDSSHTVNIHRRNESRRKNKMRSATLNWLTKSTNLSLLWFATLKTSLMMRSRSAEMSLSRFN